MIPDTQSEAERPRLVLSLFPGLGFLDRAFEGEGFAVVRGPDVLWGGDVREFHVPAGRFDGVIGGPPCQVFSALKRLNPLAGEKHGNLIPEFERVVGEASPGWFLMENVKGAPEPVVEGYGVTSHMLRDDWVGGETRRLRRFSFGVRGRSLALSIEQLALHRPDPDQAVTGGSRRVPVLLGGSGKVKVTARPRKEGVSRLGPGNGERKMIGNGVPLPMGRAVARAVKRAMYPDARSA